MSLQGAGNFMAFTYSKDKTNPDDASNVAMMWSKGIPGYRQGFFYNEDIVIKRHTSFRNCLFKTVWNGTKI
ncbi:hypothetical protein AAHB43_05630 [Staphylococcus pseudintermedius]